MRGSSNGKGSHVLQVRDIETGREKELYRAPIIRTLAVSPDGRQLAFAEEDEGFRIKTIKVMPAAGGEARELLRDNAPKMMEMIETITTIAWMPDGRHLLFGRGQMPTEVWRIASMGGKPQRTGLAMPGLRGLCVHPDGRRIAFTAGLPETELWVMGGLFPAQAARAPAPRRQ